MLVRAVYLTLGFLITFAVCMIAPIITYVYQRYQYKQKHRTGRLAEPLSSRLLKAVIPLFGVIGLCVAYVKLIMPPLDTKLAMTRQYLIIGISGVAVVS